MKLRILALVLLGIVCTLFASQVHLTTDATAILPSEGDLQHTLVRAQNFEGAQILLVEIDGTDASRADLVAAVEALSEDLLALEAIESVRKGVTADEGRQIAMRMLPYSTALVPYDKLAERVSDAGIREKLTAQLALLGTFQGMMQVSRIKDDPLDLIPLALGSLGGAQPGVQASDGILLDATGTRALLMATTAIPPGDVVPDDARIQAIHDVVDASTLPAIWFGGHRMAHDTATSIKADVELSAGLGMVLLAAVLFFGFRTWRPVVGALAPALVATGCASAAAYFASPVHALQLGFSAALAGLAVDYWVHLYLAAAAEPNQTDLQSRYDAAIRALNGLLPALAVSAGSTAVAFGVLTTSTLPLVQVLGLTGSAAAVGAFLGTSIAGPLAWAVVGRPAAPSAAPPVRPWAATGLLLACGVLLLAGMSARFDPDPLHLVARSESTRAAEAGFAARYGMSSKRALVLLESATAEDALDRAWTVQRAFDRLGFVSATGPATVLPGARAVHASRELLRDLPERLDRIAAEVGLPLEPGTGKRIQDRNQVAPLDLWKGTALASQVSIQGRSALVSVPLTDDSIAPGLADTLWAVDGEAPLVVPTAMATSGMDRARGSVISRASLAAFLVFLLLTLRHGSPAKAALALAPAAASVAVGAGAITLSGTPWNPVSMAAMVPVLGLAVDYGVFMTEHQGPASSRAVLLSAATTLAGFSTLALASSPALFGVGVATVAGVGGAAAVALIGIPAVLAGWPGRRTGNLIQVTAFAACLIFVVDIGMFVLGAYTPPALPEMPQHLLVDHGPERRYGPTRLVRTEGIWVLRTQGDPIEAGYGANKVTEVIRPRLEDEMFTTFDLLVPNPFFQWIITRGANLVGMGLHPYIPLEHQQEIRAGDLADPDAYWLQGPPYTRKIYYHAIHDLGQALVDTPLLACTGFMAGPGATRDGHWLLARNFDSEVGVTFDRDKVVRLHEPDDGIPFISVAFAGWAGAVSGVNANGIAVAINASASDDPPRLGTPMTLIVREILERASTLEEAEAILTERNGFLSENVLVVDADHDKAALFEITPKRLAKIPVQGSLGVANHFRSEIYAEDDTTAYRKASGTTAQRLARMEELLQGRSDLDLDVGVDLLEDRRGLGDSELVRGHRHAINADIATHGVVIDATTRTLRISRFPNLAGGWVELSLQDMLKGDLEAELVRPAMETADVAIGMREARQILLKLHADDPEATERALELLPNHPESLAAHGRNLLSTDPEAGRALLQRALASPPEYPHQVHEIEELLK